MDDKISELEKLVELRNSGNLTPDEFAVAKSTLFERANEGKRIPTEIRSRSNVSTGWQKRFNFFRQYGSPWSAGARTALSDGSYLQKWQIEFNLFAFVLGVFYFVYLGLWKRALVILGLFGILISVADTFAFSDRLQDLIILAAAVFFAFTANYAYFLKSERGTDRWNPFDVFMTERRQGGGRDEEPVSKMDRVSTMNKYGVTGATMVLALIIGYKIVTGKPSEFSFSKGEITSCSSGNAPRLSDDTSGKWTCALPLANAGTPADADLLTSDDPSDSRPDRVFTIDPADFVCIGTTHPKKIGEHRYTCA